MIIIMRQWKLMNWKRSVEFAAWLCQNFEWFEMQIQYVWALLYQAFIVHQGRREGGFQGFQETP